MKFIRFAALLALCAAASAQAENASLTASSTLLAPNGGELVLTAAANYEGVPAALGWSIELPADWTLASVAGVNIPAIAPDAGTSGTLEFAFTAVPANRAEFSIVVRYPAGATAATASSTVLIRAGGKLTTFKSGVVQLSPAGARN